MNLGGQDVQVGGDNLKFQEGVRRNESTNGNYKQGGSNRIIDGRELLQIFESCFKATTRDLYISMPNCGVQECKEGAHCNLSGQYQYFSPTQFLSG